MPRTTSRRTLTVVAATALSAVAIPATAGAATMASGFESFAGCPQRADVGACQTTEYRSGTIDLGSLAIPVAQPVVLVGGVTTGEEVTKVVSDAGSVLKPISIPVPGGLAGLTGDASAGDGAVSAVPEFVADPEQAVESLTWKVRIGLTGAGLPEGCGIGTAADPILLKPTTGTTAPPSGVAPLTGAEGKTDFDLTRTIVKRDGVRYVDNAFAVPAATGCGDAIDAKINARAGLPAAPGASQFIAEAAGIRIAIDLTKAFA